MNGVPGVSPAASTLPACIVARGVGGTMASKARKARRVGRARLHRIARDLERTGDRTRHEAALTAAYGCGEPSLVPSDWDRVVTRGVRVWRETYRRLSPSSLSRWYKIAEKLQIEDCVLINGKPVSLRQVAQAAGIAEHLADLERMAQLAFYAAQAKGEVWQPTIID